MRYRTSFDCPSTRLFEQERHKLKADSGKHFTRDDADAFFIQADMICQIMEYVRINHLTLESAARLFVLEKNLLAQVLNGYLGKLSDDELWGVVNLSLARSFWNTGVEADGTSVILEGTYTAFAGFISSPLVHGHDRNGKGYPAPIP